MRIDLEDKQRIVKLVQITDTHLGPVSGEQLLGMDTDASLAHVVQLVERERSDTDLLLATGDISNSGAVSSYQRFRDATSALARHTLWLPGNHDTLDAMQQSIGLGEELCRSLFIGNWQVIMLNSTVEGEVGGSFSNAELEFLKQTLASGRNTLQEPGVEHVLVCLHHHPIDTGCDWLDEQKIDNADAFFAILDQFTHVRGALWGHIHQCIDTTRNGVRLMATPSSCIQFAPNSQRFKLDRLNPGYRWLELYPDGSIDTGVSRITDVSFNLDYDNATGY